MGKGKESFFDFIKLPAVSAGRKRLLAVMAAVVFLVPTVGIFAGELGGFQVEVGTGENSVLPPDWDQQPAFTETPQNEAEQQESGSGGELFLPEEGAQENNWENENYGEEESGFFEEQASDEPSAGEPVQNNQAYESKKEIFGSGDESGSREAAVALETPEPVIPTMTPVPLKPTVTLAPEAVTPKEISPGKQKKGSSMKKAPAAHAHWEQLPELTYWKGFVSLHQKLYFHMEARGEIRLLSLKLNGKETVCLWQGDKLAALVKPEELSGQDTVCAELTVLSYGGGVRGISVDGTDKP